MVWGALESCSVETCLPFCLFEYWSLRLFNVNKMAKAHSLGRVSKGMEQFMPTLLYSLPLKAKPPALKCLLKTVPNLKNFHTMPRHCFRECQLT